MLIRLFNYETYTKMNTANLKDNMFINIILKIFHMAKFYGFWMIIHYISTHAYTYMCTPKSLLGFITSPLLAISPVCRAIDWMRTISIYTIENMWYILGIWFSTLMTGLFRGIAQNIRAR